MYQQLWGYKVEEKLYVGVREQKRLNTADLALYARTYSEWSPVVGTEKELRLMRLSWQGCGYGFDPFLDIKFVYIVKNNHQMFLHTVMM